MKFFNDFAQSTFNACREGDDNPDCSGVAERTKLFANSSYSYQSMDLSCHSVTKHLEDEKTHPAIKNKPFKKVGYISDQLHKLELVKSETEH